MDWPTFGVLVLAGTLGAWLGWYAFQALATDIYNLISY